MTEAKPVESKPEEQPQVEVLKEPIHKLIKDYFGIDDVDVNIRTVPKYIARGVRTLFIVDVEGIRFVEDGEYRMYMSNVPIAIYLEYRGNFLKLHEGVTDLLGQIRFDYTPVFEGPALLFVVIPVREDEWLLVRAEPVTVLSYDEFVNTMKAEYMMYYGLRIEEKTTEVKPTWKAPERMPTPMEIEIARRVVEAERRGVRLGARVKTPLGEGYVYAIDYRNNTVQVVIGSELKEFKIEEVEVVS